MLRLCKERRETGEDRGETGRGTEIEEGGGGVGVLSEIGGGLHQGVCSV